MFKTIVFRGLVILYIGYIIFCAKFLIAGQRWPPLNWNYRFLRQLCLSLSASDKDRLLWLVFNSLALFLWQICITYVVIFGHQIPDEGKGIAIIMSASLFICLLPFGIAESINLIHTKAQDYWQQSKNKHSFRVKSAAKK